MDLNELAWKAVGALLIVIGLLGVMDWVSQRWFGDDLFD